MRFMPIILLAVILSSLHASAAGPVLDIKDAKRGCTFVVGFRHLSVFYERILIVAKREVPPDTPDEYFVVFVDRQKREVLRDGKHLLQPDNVPASKVFFVDPRDGPVFTLHEMKICRCPAVLWGAAGISAEDR